MSEYRNPVIRTSPRLANLNMNGNIFGGWVLSQMDIAGGITAARRAKGTVATVAIEAMTFLEPIKAGDIISVYAEVARVGTTSVSVQIEVEAERSEGHFIKVTEGIFIFVALDETGTPRPVDGMKV